MSFPIITSLQDVLPAIDGHNEFIVKRDDAIIIMYAAKTDDTFIDNENRQMAALRRECRGIEFDLRTEKLITRKYHKFDNINENQESAIGNINWNQNFILLDKLDGSMITLFEQNNGNIVAHTKFGHTNVAKQVDAFLDSTNICYKDFFLDAKASGWTPIFEWCSRKQRIIVDYKEDELILTNIRDNLTGAYLPRKDIENMASRAKIPLVSSRYYSGNIQDLFADIHDMSDIEGFVVQFDDGMMIKLKTAWYLRLHRFIADFKSEKCVLQLVLNDSVDDLLGVMPEHFRNAFADYNNDVLKNLIAFASKCERDVEEYKSAYDRKTFSLQIAPKLLSERGGDKNKWKRDLDIIYSIWSGINSVEYVKKIVLKKSCNLNTIEEIRDIIGRQWRAPF